MKNIFRQFATQSHPLLSALCATALVAVIGLSFTACGDGSGGNGNGTGTAPTITTATLPNGTAGTAYSQTLAATGDTPITWSKESGDLPNGLTLSTAGVISGTPTTANTFNFTVKATNATGSGTKQLSITIASGGGGNAGTYIITGSGTTFTATKNGATVGTANQTLQTVGNAVRTDANGANCTIQFGNGTNVLDIGTETVQFNNTGGTWGVITITGKITSSATNTIWLVNGVSLNSTADIANTTNRALYNDGTGTVTITSGTINGGISNGGGGVTAGSWGTLIINGGTINGRISNGGALTVNNGTIVSQSGITISNTSESGLGNVYTVTINGGTVESNGTTSSDSAISNTGPNILNITGGVIKSAYYTIRNYEEGTTNISGGMIETTGTSGRAIYIYSNNNTETGGTVNITGGTVKATGSAYAVYNSNSGSVITIGAGATIIGNKYGY